MLFISFTHSSIAQTHSVLNGMTECEPFVRLNQCLNTGIFTVTFIKKHISAEKSSESLKGSFIQLSRRLLHMIDSRDAYQF